ncbi:BaiN/RdsA family NAD(P)/FAD-dependent oxidoreductase [Nitrincola tapanii]|uniref:NAD(P)/FAD-dependent oxidoreductase n=1 Tax=Nitrincola tapanii TaxID=1708751 RepID=A0A5A9W166_9GAMM|nr:NAD(P)/FAD-dependent oxidoreductase [Nitrincola tapanii]KAA0874224.1 NAD(P)/FAD-dependent oxidoreductase [Nitrincola tapanii]
MPDTLPEFFDVIVIGAGAAGLMCAATAGQRGRRVLVLDHANKVGKKILMSGGGRCNFTNLKVEPTHYLSANHHFCISALRRYTSADFIELVDRYALEYHEKTLGQLFCNHRAKDVLNILLAECELGGVQIETRCVVHQVSALSEQSADCQSADCSSARYRLHTARGVVYCESLVVATGGLSIPTLGSSGFGYDLARQFGLAVTDLQAALVPFVLNGEWLARVQALAGVALPVEVSCQKQSFREALLFTHKGLSGPAILQISSYWKPGEKVTIDLLPGESLVEQLQAWQKEGRKAELKTLLAQRLPKRLVQVWLDLPGLQTLASKPLAELSKVDIQILADAFHAWPCWPAGTEGYKTAEVTLGGVSTDAISSKTFEAKTQPGLFFIGEVLDVTGWLGGYNFQWAWASGWCAGQYV